MSMCDISKIVNLNYSSVRTIIYNYKKTGRTNKLLTYLTKNAILKGRREEKAILKEFKRRRQESESTNNGEDVNVISDDRHI